ncbi:MAG: SxtJ family membrane protein [Bacteroidota bacterium]
MEAQKQDQYQSLLVMATGFLALSFLVKNPNTSLYLQYAALGVSVISLLIPAARKGILWVWFKLAEILGWINGRILLSLVFFVVLFPFAVLFRLATKNPLRLKNMEASAFDERNHTYTKKDLQNIW